VKAIALSLICALTAHAADAKLTLKWQQLPPLPNTNGVAAPFAGVSGGALIVAGGANFPGAKPWEGGKKVWHDDVFVLTQPDGEWKLAGHLPRALAYGVSASFGDELICAGGSDDKQHHRGVFALSWDGQSIRKRELPPLPRAVANACGAVINHTFYIAGGQASPSATNSLHTFFALDLRDRAAAWRELAAWPGPPRMLANAAALDGTFILAGGVELFPNEKGSPARRYLGDAYRFHPARGWQRIADLPFPAAAAPSPAPISGRNVVLLSADDGSRAAIAASPTHPGFNDAVLAYGAAHNAWTRVGTSAAPRVTAPVVSWRGRWIILSGEVRPGIRSPEVWSVMIEP
jgi:N-acetylneuraminate epimerase